MTTDFAFYGRVSTEDQQDPESSRRWQLARSESLIGPHGGRVVAEYFDIGLSRAFPWKRRPQAAALLEAFRNPDRGFTAVVVGEPARAFYGNQFGLTFPVFVHYGVQLWVPDVGGQVDPGSDAHDLVMALYGGMSKGERNRIKIRVRTAMATQAATEGRYLGGRPPYGYRLADAGPHPIPGKAATGQRAHRLELDPDAAAIVQRIFSDCTAGLGVSAIANRLNRDRIPCTSAHDPHRNRHRSGAAWVGSAVLAILRNPRYTGHQVWNKQRTDEVLIDVDEVALGHQNVMRWNPADAWIHSADQVHDAIIGNATFQQTQALLAAPVKSSTPSRPKTGTRFYPLRGLLVCAGCHRRMAGAWNNDRAMYRCKLKSADQALAEAGHPQSVYVREDHILEPLDHWLDGLFAGRRRASTVDTLYEATADPASAARRRTLTADLQACDKKLATYRAALEAGADPKTVSGWIGEITAIRTRHQIALDQLSGDHRLSRAQIAELVDQMASIAALLSKADPEDRAAVYDGLGLRLTYRHQERLMIVESSARYGDFHGVRGGT